MKRVHIVVTGRVQGVFFRQGVKEKALAVGVRGWVRNRTDGTVEIVAEGATTAIDALEEWCHHGPEMAHVEHLERIDEMPAGLPEGFDVRPTS